MSFPRYASYRDTGVDWLGRIPSHWNVAKFRHSFIESGEKIDDEVVGVMLSVSGYRGIEVKEYDDENRRRLNEELVGYRIVRPDQLVVNTMWLNYAGLGVSEHEGHVSPAYRAYWIAEDFDKRYVHHMMRSEVFVRGYTKFLTGIRPNSLQMSREDLMAFQILKPPRDEQSAIAAFLDRETAKTDALIAEQEKLIALLTEKRQATISHAVTKGLDPGVPMKDSGLPWLGEVPAHWVHSRKLLDLVQTSRHAFVNGPFGSDLLTSELVEEGVPVVYIRDIKETGYRRVSEWCVTPKKAEQLAFCNVLPGDVLIAKVGDPPGIAATYPADEPEGIVTQDVIRMRMDLDKAHPDYMCWLLNSRYGRAAVDQISVEATRTRVGLGEYKQLRFSLPPLEEQCEICEFLHDRVSKMDLLRDDASSGVSLLRERRSALITAAVTGQIDVRNLMHKEAA